MEQRGGGLRDNERDTYTPSFILWILMGTYCISENVVMGKEGPWPQGIYMTVNKLVKK